MPKLATFDPAVGAACDNVTDVSVVYLGLNSEVCLGLGSGVEYFEEDGEPYAGDAMQGGTFSQPLPPPVPTAPHISVPWPSCNMM